MRSWLDRFKAKPFPELSWADHRRNEALELIASAEENDSWVALSRHYNGFVREVAVRQLCASASPEALVELVERLNDWVPQIRELAEAGVRAYLTRAHASSLLFALEPLMALAARRRTDHGPMLAGVRAQLQSIDVRTEVYASFLLRQGKPAVYLFALLLEVVESPEPLLRDALVHRELNVRLAAVAACQALATVQAFALLRDALPGSVARVRVAILRVLLPSLADPIPLLRQALLDASPSVRNLARWSSTRHGLDARSVMTEALALDPPGAKKQWLGILGLATELDVRLPDLWWDGARRSPYSSVRLSVLRTPGQHPLSDVLEALDDVSDKVFNAAISRLGSLSWAELNGAVSARLDQRWHDLSPARRRSVLQLLAGWQQLGYLLGRLEQEPGLRAFWLRELSQWCERQYQITDGLTSKDKQAALQEKLRCLAANGLVEAGSVARVLS